ncbi:MAG: glutathione peroxidase, partial [Bacteroidota bacterium]
MKLKFVLLLAAVSFFSFLVFQSFKVENNKKKSVYDFTMKDIDGKPISLNEYKGKVIVFINVASKCGFTPQYESIEKFYENYKSKGVVVLGFPANNFFGQEPGTDEEIKSFCTSTYNVTFPMFSKISVKGEDMNPLYQFLTKKELNGSTDNNVKWNFHKIVVDKTGKVVT